MVTLIVKIGSSYPGSENLSGTLKNSTESPFIRLGATFINFSKFFPRLRLFQGLRLLILNKIPKATFIKEATSIRDSRVDGEFLYIVWFCCWFSEVVSDFCLCFLRMPFSKSQKISNNNQENYYFLDDVYSLCLLLEF